MVVKRGNCNLLHVTVKSSLQGKQIFSKLLITIFVLFVSYVYLEFSGIRSLRLRNNLIFIII